MVIDYLQVTKANVKAINMLKIMKIMKKLTNNILYPSHPHKTIFGFWRGIAAAIHMWYPTRVLHPITSSSLCSK